VVLFSVALFGEKVGPWRTCAVVIGFVGILLALGLDSGDVSARSLMQGS
jgi:drug/metabolite transporter (DMT)-like permease